MVGTLYLTSEMELLGLASIVIDFPVDNFTTICIDTFIGQWFRTDPRWEGLRPKYRTDPALILYCFSVRPLISNSIPAKTRQSVSGLNFFHVLWKIDLNFRPDGIDGMIIFGKKCEVVESSVAREDYFGNHLYT